MGSCFYTTDSAKHDNYIRLETYWILLKLSYGPISQEFGTICGIKEAEHKQLHPLGIVLITLKGSAGFLQPAFSLFWFAMR